VARYDLLIDGKSRWRAQSEQDVRRWLAEYRQEHAEDDPDAVHVQVMRLSSWSWLTGGTIIEQAELLGGAPVSGSKDS
jgi:hypothetical protein